MSRVSPILFNTEMVKAILEGRKTETRRIVKPQPGKDMTCKLGYCASSTEKKNEGKFAFGVHEWGGRMLYVRPPAAVGDILYVRETWKCWRAHRYEATVDICFRAGGEAVRLCSANGYTDSVNRNDYDRFVNRYFGEKWRPSIHMPKDFARIWLKVTAVEPKQLQDMTLDDFLNEGAAVPYEAFNDPDNAYMQAKEAFIQIWDSTIKKKDIDLYGWKANPWVWVIEFERIEKPECCVNINMEPAAVSGKGENA